MKKQAVVLFLMAGTVLFTGCASFVQIGDDRRMSIEDVVRMSEAGVGSDIILRQIETTNSRFRLDADIVIELKRQGVDEKVIEAMIESDYIHPHRDLRFDYSYYATPYHYYGPTYWGDWVPVRTYYSHWYGPYTRYRQTGLVGRFYRYGPPPQWDPGTRRWITPFERDLDRKGRVIEQHENEDTLDNGN